MTRERQLLVTAAVFVSSFLVFAFLLLSFPLIPDGDSYFHLAVARGMVQGTVSDGLPWARFSLLRDGYGDKEWLFHVLLIPFTSLGDAAIGGRLALALLNATIATVLAWLALRAIGLAGIAVPVWLYLFAGAFLGRTLRLRPETLSLILLLLVCWTAARRRWAVLTILAFAYALSYTAFHALLGLCICFFLADLIVERVANWRVVIVPLIAVAGGLLLHPHFPKNLYVWFVQNVLYFRMRRSLDVGDEAFPPVLLDILLLNLGWWAGIVLLVSLARAGRNGAAPEEPWRRAARYFWIAAALFAVLYVQMDRMAIYFIPFATLALLFTIRVRGATWKLVRSRRLAFAAVVILVVLAAAGLRQTRHVIGTLSSRGQTDADAERFGKRIPQGARVATDWGAAQVYVFWAPQARYLNFLDPIFMALPYPNEYGTLRALLSGVPPDIPTLLSRLDSDYLAFVRSASTRELEARLTSDPRLEILDRGTNVLARLYASRTADFVTAWTPPTPRAPVAGYNDVTALVPATSRCATVTHDYVAKHSETVDLEFAPWGPSVFAVDGKTVAAVQATTRAVLGKGVILPIALTAGTHQFQVTTCRGDAGPHAGFYLLRR